MFCTNCGSEINDGAAFCTSCGAPTTKADDEQAAFSTTEAPENNEVVSVQDATVAIEQTNPHLTTAVTDAEVFESIRTHAESPVFSDGIGAVPSTPGYTSAMNPDVPQASQAQPISAPQPNPFSQATATPVATPAQAPTTTAPFVPANEKKMSTKKTVLIVTAICVAILLAVAVGVFAYMQVKKSEFEHLSTEVQFAFSYSGDAANEPVGVPLLVEGTDLDGNHAEQQILATSSGGTLELLAGSYTISVDGMPASSNGVVYEVQGENARTLEIPVPSEDEETPQTIIPDLNFSFAPVAADKVSDQQVEAIKSWMTTYGVNPSEINSVATAIIDRRNAEIARITLEQEKQTALAANPSVLTGSNKISNAPSYQLTGTVRTKYVSGQQYVMSGNVCYLELPRPVKVVGTQYGGPNDGPSSNNIILRSDLASYEGKVITISAQVSVRVTASIPEAAISPIWAVGGGSVVRTF